MQISTLFFLPVLIFSTARGFEPPPPPGYFNGSPAVGFSSLGPESSSASSVAPDSGGSPASGLSPPSPSPSLSESPPPALAAMGMAPAPVEQRSERPEEIAPSAKAEPKEEGPEVLRWCAVRDDYEECLSLVSTLGQSDIYTWRCVKKETAEECLESIKKGEAEITNLEAGLAYTAFINYSMKAIANEMYCDHARSYYAVAVVSRKYCKENEGISLMDFKGRRSCHGGYSTATGWNYPITHIKESSVGSDQNTNDLEIATSFFSGVCAPSEFEGSGLCSACGNANVSCDSNANSLYYLGDSGAFRCLKEELGDIAFVRGDTPLLYSMEGPHNQSWSTKSVREFMYLCPNGGCREINGYPGSCSLGAVPANAIMASNSLPNTKRMLILETLTINSTLVDVLRSGKTRSSQLLSPSAQELVAVNKLTRPYLGKSASISQNIREWQNPKGQQAVPSTTDSVSASPSSSCGHSWVEAMLLSVLMMLVLPVFKLT